MKRNGHLTCTNHHHSNHHLGWCCSLPLDHILWAGFSSFPIASPFQALARLRFSWEECFLLGCLPQCPAQPVVHSAPVPPLLGSDWLVECLGWQLLESSLAVIGFWAGRGTEDTFLARTATSLSRQHGKSGCMAWWQQTSYPGIEGWKWETMFKIDSQDKKWNYEHVDKWGNGLTASGSKFRFKWWWAQATTVQDGIAKYVQNYWSLISIKISTFGYNSQSLDLIQLWLRFTWV